MIEWDVFMIKTPEILYLFILLINYFIWNNMYQAIIFTYPTLR
jgi:hypothetical protein